MSSPKAERFDVLTVYLHVVWEVCFCMFITQQKKGIYDVLPSVFYQEMYRLKKTKQEEDGEYEFYRQMTSL